MPKRIDIKSIAIADSFNLRRAALQNKIPYYTTISGARVAVGVF